MNRLMKTTRAAVLVAICFLSFSYGVGVATYHWPPYSLLKTIKLAIKPLPAVGRSEGNASDPDVSKAHYHSLLRMGSPQPLNIPDFDSTSSFLAWQEKRRSAFIERMLYPYHEPVEITKAEIVENEEFRQETFEVFLGQKRLFRYFRLQPKKSRRGKVNGSLPTILAFVGHGCVLDVLEDDVSYQHAFAASFARDGYLVYVMENVGMEPGRDIHKALDQALRLEGWGWYNLLFSHQRIMLHQVLLDPFVDSDRIGAAGVSTGGLLALVAAAQEPHIKAASVQGIFSSLRTSFIRDRGRHCSCGAIPNALPDFDLPILALLVTPRHLQIVNGKYDGFPPQEAQRCLDSIHPILQQLEYPDPEFAIAPGAHSFDVSSAMEFFNKSLN